VVVVGMCFGSRVRGMSHCDCRLFANRGPVCPFLRLTIEGACSLSLSVCGCQQVLKSGGVRSLWDGLGDFGIVE